VDEYVKYAYKQQNLIHDMPGRGQPWKEGGHVDDTILGEDIKDGTIQEVDLDSALQAKVNSAGGHTIQDEGTPITNQTNLNFVGAGVTAVFGAEDTTTVTIPAGADGVGYDEVQDEGTPLTKQPVINFIGAGVTATNDGEIARTLVTIPGAVADGVGYDQVQDEGSPLTKRDTVDFKGAGVTVTDDGELTKTIVTIPGGGSGAFDPYTTTPETYTYFYDEFYYPDPNTTAPNFHWERIGSVAFTVPTGQVGGKIEHSTTAVAGNVSGIRTCAGGLVAVDITKKFKVVWAIELVSGVANTAQRIGLFTEGLAPSGTFPFSSEPTPNLWFAHDGSGNWLAETNNGVTPVSIDTGVAVATGEKVYEISFDPAGTPTVTFKINGVIVATSIANIPTGSLSAGVVLQAGTAATRSMNIDTALIVNDR